MPAESMLSGAEINVVKLSAANGPRLLKRSVQMVQILFVILIWILSTLFFINAYLKMNKEEQQQFKSEFKQPLALLVVGLLILGLLLTFTGIILDVKWIQHIGVIMVFISWFTTSVVSWKKRKTNFSTSVLLALIGIVGLTTYGYFFFS